MHYINYTIQRFLVYILRDAWYVFFISKEEKQMSEKKPIVSILMGSRSDLPTMEACFNQLKEFDIPFEAHALSCLLYTSRCV